MNPFDSLAGLYDDESLSGIAPDEYDLGFLKKLGKKIKSSVKKFARPDKFIKSAVKEVKRSGKKIVKEAKRNPVVTGALIVAAGVALSPVAGAALKGAMAKGISAAKAVGSASKLATAAKGIKAGVSVASTVQNAKAAKAAAKKAAAEAKVAAKVANAIDNKTPQFNQLVNTMRAQGYSDQQIMDTWTQSQAYVDTTKAAVAQNYEGQIYQDLVSRGMSPQQASVMAPQYADDIGTRAAQQVQQQNASPGMPLLLMGGGLLLSMLLG